MGWVSLLGASLDMVSDGNLLEDTFILKGRELVGKSLKTASHPPDQTQPENSPNRATSKWTEAKRVTQMWGGMREGCSCH